MSNAGKAAERGVPSLVWRAGQERRLDMIARWAKLEGARVLEAGGGIGMYADQMRRRYGADVALFDIELPFARQARAATPHTAVAAAEYLPYADGYFDTVLSHEVIEHVRDDVEAAREMLRVLKPGGRMVVFCPNRWYPFETHGHYWKGDYHFGNTPLINYLPDFMRDRLAPHVRAYTRLNLLSLFNGLPVTLVHHQRVYGGYDNLIARFGKPMAMARDVLYRLEGTVLDTWGLSHLLIMEKCHA